LASLSNLGVLFVDRTATALIPHYARVLEFVKRGGTVVHSIIADAGWTPNAISETPPVAVRQHLSFTALPDGRTVVLVGRWAAPGGVAPRTLDLLDWRLANDVFNGGRRVLRGAGEPVALLGMSGDAARTLPWPSTWLNVDDDLGLVVVAPGASLSVLDEPARRAPHGSACFARIRLMPDTMPARPAAGALLGRGVMVFRTRVTAAETAALNAALAQAAAWTDEGVTVSVPGADGKTYDVVADFSAGDRFGTVVRMRPPA
jgi:hypothetical protein